MKYCNCNNFEGIPTICFPCYLLSLGVEFILEDEYCIVYARKDLKNWVYLKKAQFFVRCLLPTPLVGKGKNVPIFPIGEQTLEDVANSPETKRILLAWKMK